MSPSKRQSDVVVATPPVASADAASVTRRILLAAVTLAAVVGVVVGSLTSWLLTRQTSGGTPVNTQPVAAGGSTASVSGMAASRAASLVSIAPQPLTAAALASGTAHLASGFVASTDGYVVTSAHAVAGSTQLRVATADGRTWQASVVATDVTHGIAVLRLAGASGLTPLTFANSTPQPGDLAVLVARGPAGEAVGVGTVRTTGGTATVASTMLAGVAIADVESVATDDGGALLDGGGSVVGVVVSDAPTATTIAASAAAAHALITALTSSATPAGRLGFVAANLDPGVIALAGVAAGDVVVAVDPGGPAAGILKPGDVVTTVNGTPVDAAHHLDSLTSQVATGQAVIIVVSRDGQMLTLTVSAAAH